MTIVVFASASFGVYKLPWLPIVFKVILIALLLILGVFVVFYKTVDGDDAIVYLFKLIAYYTSPKYLVYKKQTPSERNENNGKKDGQ